MIIIIIRDDLGHLLSRRLKVFLILLFSASCSRGLVCGELPYANAEVNAAR
jgi:hypothetical protein